MNFQIVMPRYFFEFADEKNPDYKPEYKAVKYNITVSPASVEYSFPLYQAPVVRKLMEIKEPMSYIAKKIDEEQSQVYVDKINEIAAEYPLVKHYGPMRAVYMNAVQDRSYSIEKRMLLINYACSAAENLIKEGKEEVIPQLVQDFVTHTDKDGIFDLYKGIKPNFTYSVVDAFSFFNSLPETESFGKVRKTVFERLGYNADFSNTSENPFDKVKDKYIAMKDFFFNNYLRQGKEDSKEYMLENVLASYIWNFSAPFCDYSLSIWNNFIFINTIYNAVKVLLTVYVTEENGDEGFLEAITAFDDALNSIKGSLVQPVVDVAKKRGFTGNGDMAVLSVS